MGQFSLRDWAAPIAEEARRRREEEARLEEEEEARRQEELRRSRQDAIVNILTTWGIPPAAIVNSLLTTDTNRIGRITIDGAGDSVVLCVMWNGCRQYCRYTPDDNGREMFAERYMEEVSKCKE